MARTATKTAVVAEVVADTDLPGLPTAVAAANQLAVMQTKQEAAAQAIATEIGYEGTLTIGALEDEIRFYQRRTVESLLELGKRLLVLRELTPHGEFESAWSSRLQLQVGRALHARPLPRRPNLPIWHFERR